VQDAATDEVVIDKNADAVTPIASITKLMTAMVIIDRGLDLDARIVVSREDVDWKKGSRSAARAGHDPDARRAVDPRVDVVREPRRRRAQPHLSRRPRGVRRGDERQGGDTRHDRQQLHRRDRPLGGQRRERERPGEAGARRA